MGISDKLQVNPIRKITTMLENMKKEIAAQEAADKELYC
tara:strand:- start:1043 stop:1159 length:117 start_codon:yes stop_codon:yes gene_type:complete